jgi:parallel beta-helix repeat protein
MRNSLPRAATATSRGACLAGAIIVMCGVMYVAPAATTSDSLCGTAILEDIRVDHDVVCTGDGLIAGADGIKIDLNGYTLSGSGTGVGITIAGRHDVSITGGTIRSFATGLRVTASTEIDIKHIEFQGNPEGIDFQAGSIGNTVKESVFRDSTIRGIMLRSDARDNDIKNNAFVNDRVGILVFGGVDNTLKQNELSGSSVAGIRLNVIATGNVLKDNTVSTSLAGIEFIVTATGSAQGNDLKGNTLSANACGLKGPTAGNTLKDNVYEGNTLDTCS